MNATKRDFALATLLLLCLPSGCRGAPGSRSESNTGIPSCDAWLDSRRACMKDGGDDSAIEAQLQAQLTVMRSAAAAPERRRAMDATCGSLLATNGNRCP